MKNIFHSGEYCLRELRTRKPFCAWNIYVFRLLQTFLRTQKHKPGFPWIFTQPCKITIQKMIYTWTSTTCPSPPLIQLDVSIRVSTIIQHEFFALLKYALSHTTQFYHVKIIFPPGLQRSCIQWWKICSCNTMSFSTWDMSFLIDKVLQQKTYSVGKKNSFAYNTSPSKRIFPMRYAIHSINPSNFL